MRPSGPDPEHRRRFRLLRTFSRRMDAPMAVLSMVFFGLIVAELAIDPAVAYRPWLDRAILVLWALFCLEFLIKFAIAPDKGDFLRRRWFDAVVLAVPMFRILRVLKAFRASYSMVKLGLGVRRGARMLGRFGQKSRLDYVAGVTLLVVVGSATAMHLLERDAPHRQIRNFGEALWWSGAVVTTVACDLNPVTPGGRLLAVCLMIYGMSVFGYFVTQAVAFIQRKPD